jgi:hypothetical protein
MTTDRALDLALEALEYRALGVTSGGKDLDDRAIKAIKQARSAPVQSCYCPNCEAMGKELAALKAQPAPVQEPVAWIHVMDNTEGIKANGKGIVSITQKRKHPFGKPGVDFSKSYPVTSTPLYTTPPAAQHQCKWPTCQSEKYQQALAEQINQELVAGAAQPAVPDAFGTREGEHPQYIQGWNDCRAEMLRGMKP